MSRHDFTPNFKPMPVERLKHLQHSFEELHRQQPNFNFYFLWPDLARANHADHHEFNSNDADLVLKTMGRNGGCDTPECTLAGCGYYHSENKPAWPAKEYELLDGLMEILGLYPPLEPTYDRPNWAYLDLGQDWGELALTAALVGLEYPEMLIKVNTTIITAKRQSNHPPGCDIFRDGEEYPLTGRRYTDETKHCLDFLCKGAVIVVCVSGVFDAAAKLAESILLRLNARNRPTPGNN